jgi:hypothetical protein
MAYPGVGLGAGLHETATRLADAGAKCELLEAYFEPDVLPLVDDITKLLGEPDRITEQQTLELDSRWLGINWYEYGWLHVGAEGSTQRRVALLRILPKAAFQHTSTGRVPPSFSMVAVAESTLPDALKELQLPTGAPLRIVALDNVVASLDSKPDPSHRLGDPGLPTVEITKLDMTLRYEASTQQKDAQAVVPDAVDIFFVTKWADFDAPEGSYAGPRGILRLWRGAPGATFSGHGSDGGITGGISRFSVTSSTSDSTTVSGTIDLPMPLNDYLKPPLVAVVLFKGKKAISPPSWFSVGWRLAKPQ